MSLYDLTKKITKFKELEKGKQAVLPLKLNKVFEKAEFANNEKSYTDSDNFISVKVEVISPNPLLEERYPDDPIVIAKTLSLKNITSQIKDLISQGKQQVYLSGACGVGKSYIITSLNLELRKEKQESIQKPVASPLEPISKIASNPPSTSETSKIEHIQGPSKPPPMQTTADEIKESLQAKAHQNEKDAHMLGPSALPPIQMTAGEKKVPPVADASQKITLDNTKYRIIYISNCFALKRDSAHLYILKELIYGFYRDLDSMILWDDGTMGKIKLRDAFLCFWLMSASERDEFYPELFAKLYNHANMHGHRVILLLDQLNELSGKEYLTDAITQEYKKLVYSIAADFTII